VPTIYHTDGNAALQTEIMRCEENWEEAIYWLYQEDDFTPTARYEKGQLHYTVADQVGTITELLTEDGYIDYRQKLNLWGEAEIDGHRHYAANDTNPLKCNHRFVGQYYDDESELYYNRFRYYSPETGQYISHDPIGLLGGFNPYGYVGIPTLFIDPLGLDTTIVRYVSKAEAKAIRDSGGLVQIIGSNGKPSNKAVWVNHGSNWNPSREEYRVKIKLNDEGEKLISSNIKDIEQVGGKETGHRGGILTKSNEEGAKGIGLDVLDEVNKNITDIEVEKMNGKKQWVKCGKL
ncbi:RHS repeat-associated core domain-containing protein, partial [Aggregatibacter actinomycetemcomitans]|nr:RHS repeat-associated core domain-containing protein [Aggregatibacter actinomycetemcomitans]